MVVVIGNLSANIADRKLLTKTSDIVYEMCWCNSRQVSQFATVVVYFDSGFRAKRVFGPKS